MADVIEASRSVPVLVDFWAPWCGPCKQLTPLLEKVVKQANGKVRLVKINIDENQQLAAQMRIQSIPAVFAFVDGQPVDGFMGALPESSIKQFIDRLGSQGNMAEQIAAAVAAGREALAEKNYAEAAEIFGQVLQADPENAGALAGLARCQIETKELEKAKATLAQVAAAKANDPEVLSVKAALDLALNPVDTSEIGKLAAAVEADPSNHQARFDLAIALNAAGRREEALEALLTIMRKDRQWTEDGARKQLVKFFEAWGPKDEFTLLGRRRLSSLLFS
jgi:putative thioredoxin